MDDSLSKQILAVIDRDGSLISTEFAQTTGCPHQKIVGAIKSLESYGNVVQVRQQSTKLWSCTEEGDKLSCEGSHEARLFAFIPHDGETVLNVKNGFPSSNVALGAALKNKWLRKDGDKIYRAVDSIEDKVGLDLRAIKDGRSDQIADKTKADYKKRKLIKETETNSFIVEKGENFSTNVAKQEAELTKEMIESGQWKTKSFKPFNFNAKGKIEHRSGYLHPLLQLRGEFRHIFLEMGFSEMPTNNYIESAFWNFDALFQPQQHPARDAQDTFYISQPEKTLTVPMDYLEKVKEIHTKGGFGSTGYRSPWSFEESQKNLLRTHTTAVSARLLHKLAQDGFRPAKYFSIDKVYRNETLDATHLAEFHQVEGVIADYNLSMKHLMGMFTAFFEKIGIPNIRFKPTYNPYTEPSMEIFSFHKGLGKWVEVGNSGYFRPEMLRPMGLPEDVTVAGWGLSLERPAMIMFGMNNIRDLVGSKVKMDLIYANPVCTIDKFHESSLTKPSPLKVVCARQDRVLRSLEMLRLRAEDFAQKMGICLKQSSCSDNEAVIPGDVVIFADPLRPPYSLRPLLKCLSDSCPLSCKVHTHSSVVNIDNKLLHFLDGLTDPTNSRIEVRLVWRSQSGAVGLKEPSLVVDAAKCVQICGESNILRYLARLLQLLDPSCSLYEHTAIPVDIIDNAVDICQEVAFSNDPNRSTLKLLQRVKKWLEDSTYVCGDSITLADVLLISILRSYFGSDTLKAKNSNKIPKEVQRWIHQCCTLHWLECVLE